MYRFERTGSSGLWPGLGAKKKKPALPAGTIPQVVAPAAPTAIAPTILVNAVVANRERLAAEAAEKAALAAAEKAAKQNAVAEWKRYRDTLSSIVLNLKRGALPHDTPLPAEPASDPSLAGIYPGQAENILLRQMPEAREIARNKDAEKAARDLASRYTTGEVVQPNREAVLPPTQTSNYNEALALADPNATGLPAPEEYVQGNGGRAPFPWGKILLVAGLGVAAIMVLRMMRKK